MRTRLQITRSGRDHSQETRWQFRTYNAAEIKALLKQVPAFHRAEGGSVVPVTLRADQAHLLKIKLYFCTRDINATVAFADEDNMVIDIGYRA